MAEEIIENEEYFETSSEESIKIKDLEISEINYRNKSYSSILDSGYYMNVDYIFNPQKVIETVNKWREKYEEYDLNTNGGVAHISDVKELVKIESFSASLALEAEGGKFSYHYSNGVYRIYLWVSDSDVVYYYFVFTNTKLCCQFLRELVTCIEGVDVEKVTKEKLKLEKIVEEHKQEIKILNKILKNNKQ